MRFATRQATERTGQSLLRFRITAGAIVVICVALRLAHIASIHDSLFFENPVIDELFNDTAAQYLQTTSWLGPPRPLWKPPLYPYTLATTHALSGSRYLAPRILQAFLEGASCLLVMLIGVRLFSRTIALAGGALTALAGSLVFFTGTLVSASLAVFLGLLATAALLLVTKSESKWMFLSAGIAVGLASLNRPEMLLLTIPLAAIALNRAQIPLKQRCLWGALGVFGVALAVGPVTARNILRGGAPVLISDNGGINLYIGTAEKFGGMIGLRPGPEWDHLTREVENEYGLVPDKIKSPYYVRRSVEIITSDPLRYIRHVAYKALLFWHGYELMSNFDLYDARAQSPILNALLHDGPGLLIPFGLIGPLGLAGILLVFARRHRARVAALVPIVLCLTAMIFFVTARFRLPAIPLLALFAAFFVHDLIGYWRKRSYLTAATLSTCVLLVGVYANIDLFAENRASYARALKAERLRLESLVLADRFEELSLFEGLRRIRLSTLLELLFLRLLFSVCFVAGCASAFAAFQVPAPPALIVAGIMLVALVAALPIAVAGLGTSQAAFVYVFADIAPPERLLAMSLVLSFGILALRASMGLAFARELTREALDEARTLDA